MKKITLQLSSLLVTASLMFGLTACGGDKQPAKDEKPGTPAADSQKDQKKEEPKGEKVTLNIAARGGSHVDAINAVIKDFEKENNCEVKVSGYEAADLKKNIMLDSTKKTATFDLVMADDPWMPEFSDAGIFLDLTKEGYKPDDDLVKQCVDIGRVPYGTGDLYALPFSGNVMMLFYNEDLVKKAPTDWAEVLKVSQEAKAAGKLGYIIRGQQGNPIVSDWLPIYWAFGGKVMDGDKITIDNDIAKKALNFYKELLATGANYEKNDMVNAVSTGKAAIALGWPSWYVSGTEAKAAYAVIPNKEDANAKEYGSGMIGNWMMGVTANSGHKELAVKLLTYLTSKEAQLKEAEVGGVPTRRSVLTDKELVKKFPYFPTLLEATEKSVVRPRTPLWSDLETALGAELSAVVSGTKDTDKALAEAQQKMEQIMKSKK